MSCICCGPTGCNGGRVPKEVAVTLLVGDRTFSFGDSQCSDDGYRTFVDGTYICQYDQGSSVRNSYAFYGNGISDSEGIYVNVIWQCGAGGQIRFGHCGSTDEECYRFIDQTISLLHPYWVPAVDGLITLTPGTSQSYTLDANTGDNYPIASFRDGFEQNCQDVTGAYKIFKLSLAIQTSW